MKRLARKRGGGGPDALAPLQRDERFEQEVGVRHEVAQYLWCCKGIPYTGVAAGGLWCCVGVIYNIEPASARYLVAPKTQTALHTHGGGGHVARCCSGAEHPVAECWVTQSAIVAAALYDRRLTVRAHVTVGGSATDSPRARESLAQEIRRINPAASYHSAQPGMRSVRIHVRGAALGVPIARRSSSVAPSLASSHRPFRSIRSLRLGQGESLHPW